MKWQEQEIEKMPTATIHGEKYVRLDSVLGLLRRKCGDCVNYVNGEKRMMGKCISPSHNSLVDWRWCAASGNTCHKFKRRQGS